MTLLDKLKALEWSTKSSCGYYCPICDIMAWYCDTSRRFGPHKNTCSLNDAICALEANTLTPDLLRRLADDLEHAQKSGPYLDQLRDRARERFKIVVTIDELNRIAKEERA